MAITIWFFIRLLVVFTIALVLFAFTLVNTNSNAKDSFHLVSINNLVEQEVGRILMQQIYDKLDLPVTITPLPANRAQYEATTGISDGEIMRIFSYGTENKTVIRVPTPYYHLETMAFVRKGSDIVINNKEDLWRYKVVKVRGVKHTNNITAGHPAVVDLNSTDQIMNFLSRGRADIALTNTVDGQIAIKRLGIKNIKQISEPLAKLALYHYVHESNKHMVDKIDNLLKNLKKSGELNTMVKDAESAVLLISTNAN